MLEHWMLMVGATFGALESPRIGQRGMYGYGLTFRTWTVPGVLSVEIRVLFGFVHSSVSVRVLLSRPSVPEHPPT